MLRPKVFLCLASRFLLSAVQLTNIPDPYAGDAPGHYPMARVYISHSTVPASLNPEPVCPLTPACQALVHNMAIWCWKVLALSPSAGCGLFKAVDCAKRRLRSSMVVQGISGRVGKLDFRTLACIDWGLKAPKPSFDTIAVALRLSSADPTDSYKHLRDIACLPKRCWPCYEKSLDTGLEPSCANNYYWRISHHQSFKLKDDCVRPEQQFLNDDCKAVL